MKYILKEISSGSISLYKTIDDVIEFIIRMSNGDLIERNGYIYEKDNVDEFLPIIDAAKKQGYLFFKVLDLLKKQIINYKDVRNIHLEDNIIVVNTSIRTIKIEV